MTSTNLSQCAVIIDKPDEPAQSLFLRGQLVCKIMVGPNDFSILENRLVDKDQSASEVKQHRRHNSPLATIAALIPSAARMSASPSSTGEGGRMNCKGLEGMGEYRMACFKVALSKFGRDLFATYEHRETLRIKLEKEDDIAHSVLNAFTFSTSIETLNIESAVTIRTSASAAPSPPSVSMLLFASAWSRVMTRGSAESPRNRSLEDLRTRRS